MNKVSKITIIIAGVGLATALLGRWLTHNDIMLIIGFGVTFGAFISQVVFCHKYSKARK
jgi:uncharacterized membrane protein YsdA (DUF1294 family)